MSSSTQFADRSCPAALAWSVRLSLLPTDTAQLVTHSSHILPRCDRVLTLENGRVASFESCASLEDKALPPQPTRPPSPELIKESGKDLAPSLHEDSHETGAIPTKGPASRPRQL
jgi:hypothetical protein